MGNIEAAQFACAAAGACGNAIERGIATARVPNASAKKTKAITGKYRALITAHLPYVRNAFNVFGDGNMRGTAAVL